MSDLVAQRLAWERANPRPMSLAHAERMIVQGLKAYGFGRQYQVTRQDGFEIAVDDLLIRVERTEAAPLHGGEREPQGHETLDFDQRVSGFHGASAGAPSTDLGVRKGNDA